jgi:acetyl-CoA carboxylase biotin carboxylase subunit
VEKSLFVSFAYAVEDTGLIYIGPSPDTIRITGDQVRARQCVQRAGVPDSLGSAGTVESIVDPRTREFYF